jgi:hypothetical protein
VRCVGQGYRSKSFRVAPGATCLLFRMATPTYQRESFDASVPTLTDEMRADLDKGILRNVRILGPKSRNGRLYPRHVVEAALSKYDGATVNLNHRSNQQIDVDINNRFGRIKNPRMDTDGGVRADLHFNPKHHYAETFRWWVEHDPKSVGFSHYSKQQAEPKYIDGQWTEVIESIEFVASVDLVADAATTSGIFESVLPGATVEPKPEEIAKSLATVDAFKAFLAALIAASALKPEEKLSVVEDVLTGLDSAPIDVATPTGESFALTRLARRGKVGAWASGVLLAAKATKQQTDKLTSVKAMIAEAKLPDAMASESLINLLVGVSDEQAKVIVDGMKESLSKLPSPTPAPTPNPTKTNNASATTVNELVASMWGK